MGRKLQNGYIESENISFPQMGDQKSPWSTAEKTEQFCGRMLWVSYKTHKTLAHPLEQIHSATQQAESRPLTLPRMHSMLEEPLGEEVPIFEENASGAVKCIGSILDVIIPSNTYMGQSLSDSLRIQYVL